MMSIDGTVFFILNCIAAVSIWYFAKAQQYSQNTLFWGQTLLPLYLLSCIFFSASINGNPASISLEVNKLHVPIADIRQSERETYFIAGDSAQGSDLIVRPYYDKTLSNQVAGTDNNRLVWIEGQRESDAVTTYLCFGGYAPDSEFALPGMFVQTGDDDALPNYEPRCETLAAEQEPRTVRIFTQNADDEDNPVIERRSFSVSRGQIGTNDQFEAVTISLNTGMRANLQNCDATALRIVPTSEYADDIGFLPANNLQFSALGTGGAYPLINNALLGVPTNIEEFCQSDAANFLWPVQVAGDDSFSGPRIAGNVRRTLLSWFPAIFVLISCCFMHFIRASFWANNPVERTAIAALHWLLAIRILVGNEGLFFNAKTDVALVFWDILGLYCALPITACAMIMHGSASSKKSVLSLALVLLGAILSIGLWLGVYLPNMEILVIILLAFATLAARYVIPAQTPLILVVTSDGKPIRSWLKSQPFIGKIIQMLITAGRKAYTLGSAVLKQPWKVAAALLLCVMLLRIMLVILGWLPGIPPLKERIGPIAISLFYVPLTIFGFAYLIAAYRGRPSPTIAAAIILLAIVGLFVSVFASDLGALLLHLWPVLMLVGFYGLTVTRIWQIKQGAPLLAATALLPCSLFIWGIVLAQMPIAGVEQGLTQHMADVMAWERMDARLLYYVAPERVDELGTLVAFEMRDFSAAIDPLVASLSGRGYLVNANIPSGILRYQYDDNLSAVHLMLPFGRLGIVGFIIFMFAFAAAFWSKLTKPDSDDQPVHLYLASNAALLTLLWAAVYMTLAHLNLVPFTGRNIYFLAVTSGGDALEGLVLLLVAAIAPLLHIYRRNTAKEAQ